MGGCLVSVGEVFLVIVFCVCGCDEVCIVDGGCCGVVDWYGCFVFGC